MRCVEGVDIVCRQRVGVSERVSEWVGGRLGVRESVRARV